MISGTQFHFVDPAWLPLVARDACRRGIVTYSEIEEIRLHCCNNKAMCLACEDALVVAQLKPEPAGQHLELFVWLAVAFRHGAFERQFPAILKIARELEAQAIAFQSRRNGWSRKLGRGWRRRGSNEMVRWLDEQGRS